MKTFLLALFLLASFSRLPAQFLFHNLRPADGLSAREVRSVYRDAEGFVWLGAMNGLNRFDGSHFRIWNRSDERYPSSLGEAVSCITEHGEGKIWFGTDAGVGIWDKHTNRFSQPVIKPKGKLVKDHLNIAQFQKDGRGRLWMATSKGVFIEYKGILVPASSLFPFAGELDEVNCFHGGFVFDSVKQTLWISSWQGLYAFDEAKQQVYSAKNNPGNLPIFNRHSINSLAADQQGNIWYGDIEEKAICFYDFQTREHRKIARINDNPLFSMAEGANALFYDRQGRLWISTWLYSVFVRNENGVFEKMPYDENLPYSIGYGFFNDAIQDNFGNIWLATINGVSRYNPSYFVENIIKTPSYPFFLTTDFANVNTVMMDRKGSWWLGKMEGLIRYDTAKKTFERYILPNKELRWNEVFDLDMIGGEIWCATGNGIQLFDPVKKTFRPFRFLPKNSNIAAQSVSWIQQDAQGYVWFSVWYDAVYRYDPRTNASIRFDGHDPRWGDLSTTNSSYFFEAADKRIYITDRNHGVRIFDPGTQRFTRPADEILGTEDILCLQEDRELNLWVSTRRHGILKYNQAGKLVDSITSRDGLPGSRFFEMCFDETGRLWAVSREAMVCIEPLTRQVTQLNLQITFSFNDHWNSLMKNGDRIYATMLDNLVIIDIKKFQQLPRQIPPLISGFKVFEEDMSISRDTTVQLTYRQNFFSIDFSSPFHQESAAIQYAYMLEGFDKDWVYSGRKQTASYTNVPDGHYTFKVRSTDGSNNWMKEMTLIPIRIQPPFWKTPWFLSLALLALGGLIAWVYQLRRRKQRQRRIEATIDYFANSVYGENSVNEICWDIARNCISQLQFEDCVVYLLDEKTNRLVQKAAYGPKNPKGHEIVNPIEIDVSKGIVGAVASTGKAIMVNDTSKDARYIVDDVQRLSELSVPILHDNKVIGVIDSEHPEKNFFTDDHLKALTTIASISANKIAEAQAEAYAKENEIKLLEINKLLAESQLMALRAQMNPHFVFNCLNSIQECIVTQKYGEASNYLNKFSKLFRSVLNNSGRNLVTIDEEKEVLRLYLELEQMRFEQSFSYEMIVDEDLETDEILIPSMLLQPYVENALWHGLMHKEGDRHLRISFNRIDEDTYRCTIDDNGIGRERSVELKSQSKAKRHESKGLKISSDRIHVLDKQGFHAILEITDKYHETGQPAGTTVTIELSTFLKN